MTTDTPRTYAEAEVKNYCDHKFVSVQECTLCGKTFDVLPSENECWENFEAVCNKIKTEAEVERLKEEVIAAKESEAVWKTERDKADQRRLEAEADVKRIQYINLAQVTIIDGAKTEMEKLQAEVERLRSTMRSFILVSPIEFERMEKIEAEVERLNHQLLKTESDLLQSQDINSFLDTEFRIACKRAEKAEAEVERLRKQLTRAIEIAEAVLSELHFPQWNDELDAIKATLNKKNDDQHSPP